MAYAPERALVATPIGMVEIIGTAAAVERVIIHGRTSDVAPADAPTQGAIAIGAQQISDYFSGTLREFTVPIVTARTARGGALRAAIASLPYGQTASYGQLARAHGSGAQAVGQACSRNPLPIIIPCHRVTSSGGAPEHYSGGDGVTTKAWLNAHEARNAGTAL